MNVQNFGDHFSPPDVLDETSPVAEKQVGLLTAEPERLPDPADLQPQTRAGSETEHGIQPLDDQNLKNEPATPEVTVFPAPLLDPAEAESLRTRWNEVQAKFVDEPRSAVQEADVLVSEVVEKITRMFADEHNSLDNQWNQGNDVSTEELRMALHSYRSFFNRLVV